MDPAVETQILNHWATREVPLLILLTKALAKQNVLNFKSSLSVFLLGVILLMLYLRTVFFTYG